MPTVKNVGEPCAGEPHARFEVAAGGNQASRASTCRGAQAPLADPTYPNPRHALPRGAGVCLVVGWDNALVPRGASGARELSGPERLAEPAAVCLDPFPTFGCGGRERQVEDRDRLLVSLALADRDDLVAGCHVDASDGDGHAEHGRVERCDEMLLEQCEQAGDPPHPLPGADQVTRMFSRQRTRWRSCSRSTGAIVTSTSSPAASNRANHTASR